jgi:hypothetical protein
MTSQAKLDPNRSNSPSSTGSTPAGKTKSSRSATKRATSARKIAANILNSKKSRGPRTARGKSHSRLNALDTGAYADPRLLSPTEVPFLKQYRFEVYAEYRPVGISETTIAEELAFNMLRRNRIEFAERAFFDKVLGMELVRLKDSLTDPEQEVFVEIMIKLDPIARTAIPVGQHGYKVPGPPESKEEMVKRIEQQIALVSHPNHLVEHAHVGAETMALTRPSTARNFQGHRGQYFGAERATKGAARGLG